MNTKTFFTLLSFFFFFGNHIYSQELALNVSESEDSEFEKEMNASIEHSNDTNGINNTNFRWEFMSLTPNDYTNPEYQEVDDHEFGNEIACLKYLSDKLYITKENPVPGDPGIRTIIKKQNVYNAVRNIEKFYKKQVKKGVFTVGEAQTYFKHVLEVAIAVVYEEDTQDFEKAISKERKNMANLIHIFSQVKLTSIYKTNKETD